MKDSVELGPVQETLLIPLLGRAAESRKPNGMLYDAKALEIVDRLDYDFEKWRRAPSLAGASVRTLMYDEMVAEFLHRHPDGTVVEIGCGLNTRFDRLDNGRVHWFDLDLPDVIAMRRRYFTELPRCQMLEASFLNTGWMQTVAESNAPHLFVSEAVLIYLDNHEVKRGIAQLAERFPEGELITDTTNTVMVSTQDQHDAMRHLPKESWFRWACDAPSEVAKWTSNWTLQKSVSFADVSPSLAKRLPWKWRLGLRFFREMMRRKIDGYRINHYAPDRSKGD